MIFSVNQFISTDTPCMLCHGHQLRVIAVRGRHRQELTTTICTGCGLVHSYPIPTKEELDTYYRKQYRSDYKGAFKPQRKHILRYSRGSIRRIQHLQRFAGPQQRVLEVGSGSGEFLYLASLAGYRVEGLEPHEGYSAYTRETFGIPIITAPLENADIPAETYDVVVLNHVLEHLPSPLASLSHIHRLLKRDGWLAVEVPDLESNIHAFTNRFHYAHIYNFNQQTLKAVLEKAGFTVGPHPDFTGTTLFARKTGAAEPQRAVVMPENYRHLSQLFSKEQLRTQNRERKPAWRMLKKWGKYTVEYIQSQLIRDPRSIVEREFSRAVRQGRVQRGEAVYTAATPEAAIERIAA